MHNYILKRSKRKTLGLEITADLQVLVRAPIRASKAQIESFVHSNEAWINRHLESLQRRLEENPPVFLSDEELDILKKRAREFIPGRVEYYGNLMGLIPTGIKITTASTRFGSCSPKNSLCFSCRLMLYSPKAIDLVVVHELAHILHKNHGPDFYACIASVLPDHKERKKLLKRVEAVTDIA